MNGRNVQLQAVFGGVEDIVNDILSRKSELDSKPMKLDQEESVSFEQRTISELQEVE